MLNSLIVILSFFSVIIIFSWLAFGRFTGIIVSILALFAIIWLDLKFGFYQLYVFTIVLFLSSLIGYIFSKNKDKLSREGLLRSEELEEKINLLSHDIEVKRGYIKSLGEKLQGYSVLKKIAEEFSAVLLLDDVNKLIVDNALSALHKKGRAFLFLVDFEKQELKLSFSRNTEDEQKIKVKKGDFFDNWILKYRKPLFVEDIAKDFRFPEDSIEEAKKHFRSLIAAPLVSENRIIGVLRIDSLKESAYTQDDLRMLDIISDLGAVAVQNSVLYSKAQELAMRDGLTGLLVRRYFMERCDEELKRAARKKEPLSLLMLDIDHFKNYNDKYGHTAGDLVLKKLARKISHLWKNTAIISRYGGEEFAILISGADIIKASKEAENLRKSIEDEPVLLRNNKIRMTVSIGVSSYPKDAVLQEGLIRAADEKLYKAKAQGRNKVCF